MFERSHLQTLITRIKEKRRFIQVIMGPRQVGKTTMVAQLMKKMTTPNIFGSADAAPVSDASWIESLWESARLKMEQENLVEFLLIIDEIQKVSNWCEIVKHLWDIDTKEGRNLKVILLGSSRLLLQQELTESLAGRFEGLYLGHWSFNEMHQAFGWDTNQYVWFGSYPGSAGLIIEEERWKDYISNSLIETSITKDIIMLTRIHKPTLMRSLFELGCVYSGQIRSYTKMLGQLQQGVGNTNTLSHYLNLLDTAGLLTGLNKYPKNIIRRRSSSPKFQVYNTALISAQCNELFSEIVQKPSQWGRMVASSIGAHLINYSLTEKFDVYYWRDRNEEVDFILEQGEKVIGVEVTTSLFKKKTSGMQKFKEQFNPNKTFLIGGPGLPWQEFLTINPGALF